MAVPFVTLQINMKVDVPYKHVPKVVSQNVPFAQVVKNDHFEMAVIDMANYSLIRGIFLDLVPNI